MVRPKPDQLDHLRRPCLGVVYDKKYLFTLVDPFRLPIVLVSLHSNISVRAISTGRRSHMLTRLHLCHSLLMIVNISFLCSSAHNMGNSRRSFDSSLGLGLGLGLGLSIHQRILSNVHNGLCVCLKLDKCPMDVLFHY